MTAGQHTTTSADGTTIAYTVEPDALAPLLLEFFAS